MTVQDVLDIFTAETNYVANSMISKSFDDKGCVFVWLCHNHDTNSSAFRREIFIATSTTGDLFGRTVIEYVEVAEPRS